ncbi:unnamed protein product [Orchesella dallaii]|uniref:O-acyltransferase WSD1 C-terminal domain-containing protein n=1 Tax=Orchesella dallaii TaxID=48710 RepID=A0ABP1QRJ5_9HEXA
MRSIKMGYLQPNGLFQFLISLTIYILLGPTFLFVLILNELARLFVSLCLRINYGGKISLIPYGSEALWALKRPYRPRMSSVIAKIDKSLTREQIKQTLKDIVLPAKSSNGDQVYLKLKKILIVKYGYGCWKQSEKFDLDEHVRSLPDNKVYNKAEFKQLIDEWSEDMSEERPQWEFIIVPRFFDDADESETSLFIFRVNHAYMDGFCYINMYKKYLTTGITWYINPFEFHIPFWKIFLFYLNAVTFGAYATILLAITKTKKFWTELPSNGSPPRTYYAWAKQIDAEVIRKIRKKLNNPPLSSLIVNAYVTAAKEILPVGRVPDLLRVMELGALLPYPNDRLQNRFSFFYYGINSCQPDFERINATKKESWKAMTGPWILTTYSLIRLFGRFPVCFHSVVVAGGPNSLVMNNVPISKTRVRILESSDVLELLNFPPNPTDTGMQLLCFSYDNSIKITGSGRSEWFTEKEFEDIIQRIPGIIHEWAHKLAEDEVEAV